MAREALEAALPLLWVGGEISNLTRASSGHVYFTLKDANAQVRCAMWRNRAQLLAFRPENGMRVEARALVTLYEARGDYQLNVEALRPAGIGNLFEAFNRLKAKLAAEGLFDPDQRRPLPRFPRAVGIVTSLQAAALRDVLVTLRRRAPHLPVVLYPAPVQGADAAARLVAAVRDAGRRAPQDGVDLLLLVRGGGSIEDLWSFNDEALARALRACPLPVVCGVGHETDFTIADFVADLRAPTPTAAAELASAPREQWLGSIDVLQERIDRALRRRLDAEAQRIDWLAGRLGRPSQAVAAEHLRLGRAEQRLRHALALRLERERTQLARWADRLPRAVPPALAAERKRLQRLAERLPAALVRQHESAQQRLERAALRLAALDPQRVLERGYAWLQDEAGHPVTRAAQTTPGQPLAATLADGKVDLRVLGRRSG